MASTLLTIGGISKKNLFILKNTCTALPLVTSDYSSEFAVTGAKTNNVITIRKPPKYEVADGDQAVLQNTQENFATLTLSKHKHIALPFSLQERTLSLDNYAQRVGAPKMAALANAIDYEVLQLGEQIGWAVGTPGVTPTNMLVYNQAGALLSDLGAPKGANQRSIVMTPDMHGVAAANNIALFNPGNRISEVYRTGQLAEYGGFRFYEDQNCPTHTVGALGGTPAVNGTTASGATTLVTDGWTSGTAVQRLNVGDSFTVANVYAVNPQNRTSIKKLRQFVVTAPGVETSAAMTINFSPAMIASGPNQNINAMPADNALLTISNGGTAATDYRYGVAFAKSAFGIGFADIELPPKGVVESFRAQDEDTGISMATVTFFDGMAFRTITRTDIIFGLTVLYEDLACRIWEL